VGDVARRRHFFCALSFQFEDTHGHGFSVLALRRPPRVPTPTNSRDVVREPATF
jgi:hypothetical protein